MLGSERVKAAHREKRKGCVYIYVYTEKEEMGGSGWLEIKVLFS